MNSTESLNIAIKGILNPGDHVISTVLEHNSVLRPLYEMEKKGVEVTFLGCDEKELWITQILIKQSKRIQKQLSVPMGPI